MMSMSELLRIVRPGDAVVTLGAGSIGTLPKRLMQALAGARGRVMTPVAAPADKRFRRSRVSPARKRRWRPSWWTVARVGAACLVVGFALYHTISFALASEALTVTRITVQGNQRMSRGEVLGLLDGLSGTSIVMTDLEGWRQKLLTSPWVADASIRRMFPGTLAVVISERQPIGVGRIKGTLYLIDKTGAVIDEFGPNYADLDLPIIDGLAREGGRGRIGRRRARGAGRSPDERACAATRAGRAGLADRRHRRSQRRRAPQGRHGASACWRRAFLGASAVVSRSDAGAARADAGHRLRGSAFRPTGVRQAAEHSPARFRRCRRGKAGSGGKRRPSARRGAGG